MHMGVQKFHLAKQSVSPLTASCPILLSLPLANCSCTVPVQCFWIFFAVFLQRPAEFLHCSFSVPAEFLHCYFSVPAELLHCSFSVPAVPALFLHALFSYCLWYFAGCMLNSFALYLAGYMLESKYCVWYLANYMLKSIDVYDIWLAVC